MTIGTLLIADDTSFERTSISTSLPSHCSVSLSEIRWDFPSQQTTALPLLLRNGLFAIELNGRNQRFVVCFERRESTLSL